MLTTPIRLLTLFFILSNYAMAFNTDYRTQAIYFDKTLLSNMESTNPKIMTNFDKPSVIIFWATWCYVCAGELPSLVKAAQQNKDINYVFVNQYQSMDDVNTLSKQLKIHIPNVVINNGSKPSLNNYAKALPVMLFLNNKQQIIAAHRGKLSASDLAIKTMLIRNN